MGFFLKKKYGVLWSIINRGVCDVITFDFEIKSYKRKMTGFSWFGWLLKTKKSN
jgi:hypothetical protein